jgi:hypothetical protein
VSNGESRIPVTIWEVRGRRRGGKWRDWDEGNIGRKKAETEGWMVEVNKESVTEVKRPEMRYIVRKDTGREDKTHPSTN